MTKPKYKPACAYYSLHYCAQQQEHQDGHAEEADGLESEGESDSDAEMDEAAQVAQAKAMAAAVKAKPVGSKGEASRHLSLMLVHVLMSPFMLL